VLNTSVETTLDEYVEIIIEFIEFDAIEMAMRIYEQGAGSLRY
jgi:hypothetical protein